MNLIIDIGNSVAKLAVFDLNEIVEVRHCSNQTLDQLPDLCNRYAIKKGILSSVITLNEECKKRLDELNIPIIELNYRTPVPIKNLYQTPQTLGMDRLAAVVGANSIQPGKPLLVIDAGTCITYDFIDEEGQYQGGNISPGKRMRFKALNTFTDKLPEISPEGEKPFYGKTTVEKALRILRHIFPYYDKPYSGKKTLNSSYSCAAKVLLCDMIRVGFCTFSMILAIV